MGGGYFNPFYPGPGQPQGLNYWNGNQFMMPPLPPPPPPPPPPLAPTVTPQDMQAMQATQAMGPGAGGADNGGLLGGATRDQGFADPSRTGMAYGGVNPSSPNTPANFNSNIGPWAGGIGTVAGIGLGVPGLGMASGALGQMADANRYSGVLNANNVNFSPNYASAALYGASALPFGLGSLFGESARQQSEAARRDALANGVLAGNVQPQNNPGSLAPAASSWATDPMNFDANSPSKDFGPGGFGAAGADMGGGIGTSGGQDPGAGGKGESSGGGAKGEGGGGWYAKGGAVRPPAAGLLDPPGPDDQMAGLQTGEGVLTKAAMKRHPGLLDALNKGNVKRARGLLGG